MPAAPEALPPRLVARNHVAHESAAPIDAGQQAVGLRPTSSRPLDHADDIGPPEFVTSNFFPAPAKLTEVARVTPLMTVVQVIGGVAIFGTNGGRAVTP